MKRNIFIALVAIAGFLAWTGMFAVDERKQVLITQFGNPVREITTPGLHFKIPIVHEAIEFDRRILSYDANPIDAPLNDQRLVTLDYFARFRIADMEEFYKATGGFFGNGIQRLQTVMDSASREVFGKTGFESILSNERVNLMQEFQGLVTNQMKSFGVDVVDVRVKRIDLPQENEDAVYRRMRSEREKEAREARAQGAEEAQGIRARAERERTVLLAEAERDAEQIRAKGDREGLRIVNEAARADEEFYKFWLSMQAYQKALQGNNTTMVLSPDSDFFDYFSDERKR